jgi:hypothetical protein
MYYKYRPQTRDCITETGRVNLGDETVYCYRIMYGGKGYEICTFGKNEINVMDIHNKNRVLHAEIVLCNGEQYDVTDILHQFALHFDDQKSDMGNFMQYVKHVTPEVDFSSGKLVVYLNDDDFTEVENDINDINGKAMKDVLFP